MISPLAIVIVAIPVITGVGFGYTLAKYRSLKDQEMLAEEIVRLRKRNRKLSQKVLRKS